MKPYDALWCPEGNHMIFCVRKHWNAPLQCEIHGVVLMKPYDALWCPEGNHLIFWFRKHWNAPLQCEIHCGVHSMTHAVVSEIHEKIWSLFPLMKSDASTRISVPRTKDVLCCLMIALMKSYDFLRQKSWKCTLAMRNPRLGTCDVRWYHWGIQMKTQSDRCSHWGDPMLLRGYLLSELRATYAVLWCRWGHPVTFGSRKHENAQTQCEIHVWGHRMSYAVR